MPQLIASSCQTAIVGAGVSGVSVARFLVRQGKAFTLHDTRADHPKRADIEREFGASRVHFGPLDALALGKMEEVVVSPGLALSIPELQQARNAGARLVGDIELFTRYAKAPFVAITGSNAKSTVTTLVGQMAEEAGLNVAVGGNLGTPALDLLDDNVELYVLELSSFQLETVSKLGAKVATVLNLSADHMDRYPDMPAYHQAKLRVYFGAEQVVYNSQSVLTQPPMSVNAVPLTFGGRPEFHRFGVAEHEGEDWLYWQLQPLMPASEMKIKGRHNIDNALAALALGRAVGLSTESMLDTLRRFSGLPHRCEWVAEKNGVVFYNDSKGTNVGAAIAAIEGLKPAAGRVVLIAGGDPKGATFNDMRKSVERCVRSLVLIGTAADAMAETLGDLAEVKRASDMKEAVHQAREAAEPGDVVLLSPACASFDMFENYQDRGNQFRRAVEGVA
ncbi:UDP-N-acetylmuramoyl-L-alanine--D-glutamate ligase [Marinimicrobium agarilyticum]|uniref:UDP-N-acetylmuramoyl-L-alanine--D-glutamate ligase n=1 Tax=Marinimicrobium agarilyticum TaxID=306546 RepID=UPI0003F5F650|nr:UDP-N-acetylmuramoyl-L-alanine--D-glutamate ligase [Marinimicrobium agarilyticum]